MIQSLRRIMKRQPLMNTIKHLFLLLYTKIIISLISNIIKLQKRKINQSKIKYRKNFLEKILVIQIVKFQGLRLNLHLQTNNSCIITKTLNSCLMEVNAQATTLVTQSIRITIARVFNKIANNQPKQSISIDPALMHTIAMNKTIFSAFKEIKLNLFPSMSTIAKTSRD